MLLSYFDLCLLQDEGIVVNSLREHLNAASIDITIGAEIQVERIPDTRRNGNQVDLSLEKRDPLPMMKTYIPTNGYRLGPGEFILAHSEQVFNLPNDISAEYKLKSSMARMGINHLNAGWCDAGWNGSVLTLELINCSRYYSRIIKRGDRIGQMVFFRHQMVPKAASYATKGSYNGDRSVSGAKQEIK